MSVAITLTLILAFIAGSIFYVYAYRGQARFEDFTEYLRKGWPIFTPFNCMLYMFTQKRAKHAIMDLTKFPELDEIQKNWETIRDEAYSLYQKGYFEKTKASGSGGYYDIGFRTFYKYGWSKFYINWYGHTHNSAKQICPKTVEILSKVKSVNGAMFSMLPVGGQLTRHLDPVACSLRYHLALVTPNSDKCYINVDNQVHSWRDGKGLLFDETYLHFAHNDADKDRIILMCDFERPMFIIGRVVNFFYKGLMRMTVVPNIEGDKRGLANAIFSSLSPLLQKSKALKQTNRKAYLLLKYSVNLTLGLIVFALIAGLVNLSYNLAKMFI